MANVDFGPASGNAELSFLTNAPGLECHVGTPSPSGLNPLDPNHAPFAEPNIAYTGPIVFNKLVASNINFSNPS
jgi:hypothetical protein